MCPFFCALLISTCGGSWMISERRVKDGDKQKRSQQSMEDILKLKFFKTFHLLIFWCRQFKSLKVTPAVRMSISSYPIPTIINGMRLDLCPWVLKKEKQRKERVTKEPIPSLCSMTKKVPTYCRLYYKSKKRSKRHKTLHIYTLRRLCLLSREIVKRNAMQVVQF